MKDFYLPYKYLLVMFLLVTGNTFAQLPTVTSFTPSVVTQRVIVTINGTNFTGTTAVKFGSTNALSFTVVSDTQILATVNNGSSGSVVVTNASGNGSKSGLTFKTVLVTPTAAKVTRVISDWNSYWSSTEESTDVLNQPNDHHNLLGFTYNDVIYSTGVNDAALTTNGATPFTSASFNAFPVTNMPGTTGSNSNIIAGQLVDGNANVVNYQSSAISTLTAAASLTDGIRGLDLGTGVTNISSSAIMSFSITSIESTKISDSDPDILVTQIAVPTSTSDIYFFADSNGNVIGSPIAANLSTTTIPYIATYRDDLFSIPANLPYATATATGNGAKETKTIKMIAYKLSDFGLDAALAANVSTFNIYPGGASDMAFIAYNGSAVALPAPAITTQPVSQAVCAGTGQNVTFNVGVAGTVTSYQWKKNGTVIPGAINSSYTINNVDASHTGAYTVVIANSTGTVESTAAYLNTVITAQPQSQATCQGTGVGLLVTAYGANLSYQWYSNTANNNTSGTIINGATSNIYTPSVSSIGTKYYYAVITSNGLACTTKTNVAAITVSTAASVGTTSGNQTVCPNNAAIISIANYSGTVQWQQSANGNTGWENVTGGIIANPTTYVTPALTTSTYFRAVATNGSCTATSGVISITVAESYIWTGALSSDWNAPGNWSCGTVPTSAQNVVITNQAANQPEISETTGYAKSLTLSSGAVLNILSTGTLEIANEINVAADAVFTVQNNGSILQTSTAANTGKIIVKKKSNMLYRLDYTMWSSPVTGQPVNTFSPWTATNRFYTYGGFNSSNEYQDQYFNVTNLSLPFSVATGYLIRMPNSITGTATGPYFEGLAPHAFEGSFNGVPNNGTITKSISALGNRYTAIGNPYPSPISVEEFFMQNQSVLDGLSGMYFWRKKNNADVSTYATLTLAGFVANGATPDDGSEPTPGYAFGGQDQSIYFSGEDNSSTNWLIAPGQGFIVQTKENLSNPQVTFNNSMRKAAPTTGEIAFLKTAPQKPISRVWINLSSSNSFSQTAIVYMNGATTGLDYGYDARKFINGSATLYTAAENEMLSIQARPNFDAGDVVPMGYVVENSGNYTIALDHFEGVFNNGQDIFVHDNLLGITRNLNEGNYSFTSAAGNFADRFKIVYNQPLSVDDNLLTANNVVVYKEGSAININTGTATMANVTVYDIRGRQLYNAKAINATQFSIPGLAVQQEVLIVQVNTDKGTVSKKIVY